MSAVLYEMLTGVAPFAADSMTATLEKVLHSDPPMVAGSQGVGAADRVEFLSFSLADAIASSLTALDTLVVRSSMLAARFATGLPDLEKIAAEASVDVVVSGTPSQSCEPSYQVVAVLRSTHVSRRAAHRGASAVARAAGACGRRTVVQPRRGR